MEDLPRRKLNRIPKIHISEPVGLFLSKGTKQLVELNGHPSCFPLDKRHHGLHLDKFTIIHSAKEEDKKKALNEILQIQGSEELLEKLFERRSRVLETMNACRVDLTTTSSLALHISRSGAWENAGICFHPVYGFPYIPGSGIKGLVRSWAETIWAPDQDNQEEAWKRIDEFFGYGSQSESYKYKSSKRDTPGWRPDEMKPELDSSAGRLVFHDAWPREWPLLDVDITNNHHTDYYSKEKIQPPGDWENPVPVYFLCVKPDTAFEFAISDRNQHEDGSLKIASAWLTHALQVGGAGAKTNAGYGRFKPNKSVSFSPQTVLRSQKYDLELVTPAFLAGAHQNQEDCDLRGSTLRGLLRWWWRTMYTDKISIKDLKRLEEAIWGSVDRGGPLSIAIRCISDFPLLQYTKEDDFLLKHGISSQSGQRGNKTTMGLFYYTYGLAEGKGDVRWCRSHKTKWEIVFTTRESYIKKDNGMNIKIDAEEVKQQASAALWLLCHYGGIGAKSRKGFGSLADISVDGLESWKNCSKLAEKFALKCQLKICNQQIYGPSLNSAIMVDFSTQWDRNNPWYACHMIGEIVKFATKELDKDDRPALGTPRGLKGVDMSEFPKRHSSPILWSLDTDSNEKLLIRLIVFPSPKLPNARESEEILKEFIDCAKNKIRNVTKKPSPPSTESVAPISDDTPYDSDANDNFQSLANKARPPANGDIVEAEILPEKTKKGKRKAKHVGSGWSGPIIDDLMDKDVQDGQRVKLYVQSIHKDHKQIGFKWNPPPQKNTQSNKRNSATRSNHRGVRR